MKKGLRNLNQSTVLGLLGAAVILANVLASFFPFKIDLTEEQLYTLSPESHQLLEKITEPITLKFYFNRSVEGVPIPLKNYATRVQELLLQYKNAAGGKVAVEIIDPQPDTHEEEAAIRSGISGQPLGNGQNLFFGLLGIQAEQEESIPFFDHRRERFLEYDISQLLFRVQHRKRAKIGIITSLDIFDDPNRHLLSPSAPESEEWAFLKGLHEIFDIEPIKEAPLSEDLSVLAIIHPQEIDGSLRYAIDQFLLSGKPVFIALDPSFYWSKAQQPPQHLMLGGSSFSSDLPEMLEKWGIEYDPLYVVGDLNYAATVNFGRGEGPVRLPTWLLVNTFTSDMPPAANLNTLLLAEPGSLSLKKGSSLEFIPLVSSSGHNSLIPTSTLMFAQPQQLTQDIKPTGKPFTISAVIQGSFSTAFPGGKPANNDKGSDPKEAALTENIEPIGGTDRDTAPAREAAETTGTPKSPGEGFLKSSVDTSTLVLVADVDFLADDFSVQKINFLGVRGVQPINDNIAFVHNILEFLSGSEDLISLRSKGTALYPFERVKRLEVQAQQNYQAQLESLEKRLQSVQQKIQELRGDQSEQGMLIASPEIRAAIQEFRLQEAEMRAERRDIRKKLREDIESLKRNLAIFNLMAIPLILATVGIIYFIRRTNRYRH